MVIERIWTDEEVMGMVATVDSLRRMRDAAVMHKPTLSFRINKAFNWMIRRTGETYSQQEALSHAEALANAAGDFFAAKLSKTTAEKTSEFEKWQELLREAKKDYAYYRPITYAKTTLGEVVAKSVIGRLRNIYIDAEYMVRWDLLKNNNLGAKSIEKLMYQNMGVISPLSGDYLMATVYSFYLKRTIGKSFPVRAAALSKDLSELVLPLDVNNQLPFEDKQTIGIYIDATETGNTAQALWKKLKEIYPGKTVHRPQIERTEFTKSNRMKKYWGSR